MKIATYLGNLAQLMVDGVRNAERLALCSESTRHLELEEELGTLEFSKEGARVRLRLYCEDVSETYTRTRKR